VDLRSAIGRGVLVTGSFDRALGQFISQTLRTDDVFVDAGSNIGYFSLMANHLVGPGGEVHAFEVDPRALRCLRLSQRRNSLPNLIIHSVALGDRPGVVRLVTSGEAGHTFVTSGDGGRRVVPMMPLDAWLEYFTARGIRLIKIDVEGAELAVLRGARGIIERCRPVIVFEAIESNLTRFGDSVAHIREFFEGLAMSPQQLPGTDEPNLVVRPVPR
jgi:FkbM family methyltransferase